MSEAHASVQAGAAPRRRKLAPAVSAALAILAGGAAGLMLAPEVVPWLRQAAIARSPQAAALERALAGRPARDPVRDFYRRRAFAPLWSANGALRPDAEVALAVVSGAARDGLDPAQFHPTALATAIYAARSRDPALLARVDIALSDAIADYAVRLHRPAPGAGLAFVDPGIPTPTDDPERVLVAMAGAPSLAKALADIRRVNPIYAALRDALARAAPGPQAAQLRINLERARALPTDLGARYILVNPAARTLWLVEGGRVTDQMRVVVGKLTEPTPSMIGLIRYAELAPYWNVPPDLAQDSIAPKVMAEGTGYLAAHHFEALSDWSANAVAVAPETIDWAAVAGGALKVRLRQLPGPDNMMGKLKFMLPNPLGVYLHDTPMKGLFDGAQRTDSSGCVRLADASELGTRLFGGPLAPAPGAGPEQRVDLASPVPVYIVYLTAEPFADGVRSFPDVYRRDPALLAAGYFINSQTREPAPARAQ